MSDDFVEVTFRVPVHRVKEIGEDVFWRKIRSWICGCHCDRPSRPVGSFVLSRPKEVSIVALEYTIEKFPAIAHTSKGVKVRRLFVSYKKPEDDSETSLADQDLPPNVATASFVVPADVDVTFGLADVDQSNNVGPRKDAPTFRSIDDIAPDLPEGDFALSKAREVDDGASPTPPTTTP